MTESNSSNGGIQTSYSHSKFNTIEFKHVWRIDDCFIPGVFDYYSLPKFSVLTSYNDVIEFSLKLLPGDIDGFIKVKLCLESGIGDIKIKFTLGLQFGDTYITSKKEHLIFDMLQHYESEPIKITDLDRILSNNHYDNKLIIIIRGSIIDLMINPVQNKDMSQSKLTLVEDIRLLFSHEDLSDITFCASGIDLPAHKAILAARSPIFKEMFTRETKDQKLNRIDITDIKFEVFRDLLHFMYTGEALNINNMPEELLVAADKYALTDLKKMCENVVSNNITVENAVELIVLADVYCCYDLKEDAVRFIQDHAKKVMQTDGWKILERKHPHLITEICHALVKPKV